MLASLKRCEAVALRLGGIRGIQPLKEAESISSSISRSISSWSRIGLFTNLCVDKLLRNETLHGLESLYSRLYANKLKWFPSSFEASNSVYCRCEFHPACLTAAFRHLSNFPGDRLEPIVENSDRRSASKRQDIENTKLCVQ